jgi:valyl-tRNA synthetase
VHVLDAALRLLHPVMPFLTEELWQRLPHRGETIALAAYPMRDESHLDEGAEKEIALLMEIVARVRNIRAELNIDPARRLPLLYHARDGVLQTTIAANAATIAALARLDGVRPDTDLSAIGPAARGVAPGVDLAVPLAGVLDLEAEKSRLSREIEKLVKEQEGHARKLENAEFLAKARPEIVDKARRIHQELQEKIDRLSRTVASLR